MSDQLIMDAGVLFADADVASDALLMVVAVVLATLVVLVRATRRHRGRSTDRSPDDPNSGGSEAAAHAQSAVPPPAIATDGSLTLTSGDHIADTVAADADVSRLLHELRTPLNGVLGLATLMLYDELSAIQRERLLDLRDAGQHLLAILDNVRDTGADASEPVDPGTAPFRLGAVIDQVVDAYTQPAGDKGLTLRREIDPRFGLVVGDASQLRRMLQHLVDNAVAFTERGSIDVVAELVDRTDDRYTIRIAVRDTGIGMDRDVQRRLLAPHNADEPAPWAPGTHGLGLAICGQIIDQWGGTLEVSATCGRGTTVSCTFDLHAAGHEGEPDTRRCDAPRPAECVPPEASHATVLLVEDDNISQVVAEGMLEQLGYKVDVAADGIEAVEALRQRSYDVVLMDCGMPRLDGYATTAHVRAIEADHRHTPIIAMTAAALQRDQQRCLAAGMDDHLSKPVTIDALAAALQRAGLAPSSTTAPKVFATTDG